MSLEEKKRFTHVLNMGVKGKLGIKPETKTGDNGGECNALKLLSVMGDD